jgi:hypothetical protein
VSLAVPATLGGPLGSRFLHQLPTDIADFTGRSEVLEGVHDALARKDDGQHPTSVPIVAIYGKAGVGKTTLAIRAANAARDRYAETLYVNLRGMEEQRRSPVDVLEEFLLSMEVDGAAIPALLDDRRLCGASRVGCCT